MKQHVLISSDLSKSCSKSKQIKGSLLPTSSRWFPSPLDKSPPHSMQSRGSAKSHKTCVLPSWDNKSTFQVFPSPSQKFAQYHHLWCHAVAVEFHGMILRNWSPSHPTVNQHQEPRVEIWPLVWSLPVSPAGHLSAWKVKGVTMTMQNHWNSIFWQEN